MNKLFYYFAMLFLLASGVFLCLLAYWEFYPYHVSDYQNPIPILNPHHIVKTGEVVRWQIKVTNYYAYPYIAYQELVAEGGQNDCDYHLLQTIMGVLPVGPTEGINALNNIPAFLKPCVYYVRITIAVKVNPLRTIIINKRTEDFTVI